MKLHVRMNDAGEGLPLEMEVKQFTDLDKIAARVARRVKAFLRQVPMGKGRAVLHLDVAARYSEGEAKPKAARKRKPKPEGEKASAAAA